MTSPSSSATHRSLSLWRILAIAALCLLSATAFVTVGSPEASARCSGTTRLNNYFLSGGNQVTRDEPTSGTCDGDTIYSFRLIDGPYADTRCSYEHFHASRTQAPTVTRFTCSASGVDTNFDDTNSTFEFRFQTTGAGGSYSVWNTSTGH